MMNTRSLIATGMVCATVVAVAAFLSNAGPLNPPAGPIASTGKTLTEVEPRIAVNAANTPGDANSIFRIDTPGSYYLTGNVTGVFGKHGVEITANNVSLDLNGYTLQGAPNSLAGVFSNASNVAVRNGSARQWGGTGVSIVGLGSRVSDIYADNNGGAGVALGNSVAATRLAVNNNGGAGISTGSNAVITACSSANNDGAGIQAGSESVVSQCTAENNGLEGIATGSNASIARCVSRLNDGIGIDVNGRGHIEACVAETNGIHGIEATFDSIILNNTCHNNGRAVGDGAGVKLAGADNRVEGNHVTNNDRGVDTGNFGNNVVIRNTARGNGAFDYVTITGDSVGAIGNVSNLTISTSNPWANFIF